MNVRITRLTPNTPLPSYATAGSAAFDLTAIEDATIPSRQSVYLRTGLVIATPPGHVLVLSARSSLFKKKGLVLANGIGVIDQDFCGPEDEIRLSVWNPGEQDVHVSAGERLAQGMFIQTNQVQWEECEPQSSSRGGLGSSGGYTTSATEPPFTHSPTNTEKTSMNTNAKLFIIDDQNPQDTAMMQALYSRSASSVMEHIEKVKQSGSGKFMESFYVGYGHESIGDCGSTTMFIEGVSVLAAKAIQDWPLYSGQETSTRYIDMSKQPIEDPVGTETSASILKKWMDFYIAQQEPVAAHLKTIYPRREDEKESVYEKAIKARAFDILRGFLPAGITTQLAWHTNLRQAARKLAVLRHHPDPTIRNLGERMLDAFKEQYPQSFGHKLYDATEEYRSNMAKEYTYFSPPSCPVDVVCRTPITSADLAPYLKAITSRPQKTELPIFLLDLGMITFEFQLDFGSFRDLQRHRNGVCRMPLLTTNLGFHPWYLDQLPPNVREQANVLIEEQRAAIQALQTTDINKQYYIALGFRIPCHVSYGLPATLYTIELRSGKMVHPTLRRAAQAMARALQEKLPELVIYADMDLDDWDVRRGLQDITRKP